MSKIRCPFHDDSTASMHIYPDGKCFCFGCAKTSTVEQLGIKASAARFGNKRLTTNIDSSIRRIRCLPKKTIRGLSLHADDTGYYLIYPNSQYFIKRNYHDSPRYTYPSGHKKPLYIPKDTGSKDHLLVIEGELNALSAVGSAPCSVMSPGAASMLNTKDVSAYCLQYASICLIVDKDAAGVVGGYELQGKLLAAGKRVALVAVEEDYNDVLCKYGQEELKSQISKALALLEVQNPGKDPVPAS